MNSQTSKPEIKHTYGKLTKDGYFGISEQNEIVFGVIVDHENSATVHEISKLKAEANASELVKRWNLFPELVKVVEEKIRRMKLEIDNSFRGEISEFNQAVMEKEIEELQALLNREK